MKRTKLDIYRSAEQAAIDSLGCKNKFEIQDFANSRFKTEGLDQNDFDFWISVYEQQRQLFAQLVSQKAFSNKPTE